MGVEGERGCSAVEEGRGAAEWVWRGRGAAVLLRRGEGLQSGCGGERGCSAGEEGRGAAGWVRRGILVRTCKEKGSAEGAKLGWRAGGEGFMGDPGDGAASWRRSLLSRKAGLSYGEAMQAWGLLTYWHWATLDRRSLPGKVLWSRDATCRRH